MSSVYSTSSHEMGQMRGNFDAFFFFLIGSVEPAFVVWCKSWPNAGGGNNPILDSVELGHGRKTGKMLLQQKHMGMIEPIYGLKLVSGTVNAAFRMM